MRFACSICGRPEEVIGDDAPLCRYCHNPMIKATDSYKGLLMSPKFVIDRMAKIVGTYGMHEALTNGRLKKEREAYVSAVWSLGLTEVDTHEHWIEIETVDQTPDTKVHYLDQSAGYNHCKIYNMEIVDWEPHIDDPMQVIRQKCQSVSTVFFPSGIRQKWNREGDRRKGLARRSSTLEGSIRRNLDYRARLRVSVQDVEIASIRVLD